MLKELNPERIHTNNTWQAVTRDTRQGTEAQQTGKGVLEAKTIGQRKASRRMNSAKLQDQLLALICICPILILSSASWGAHCLRCFRSA
jgi:hypothetical protein